MPAPAWADQHGARHWHRIGLHGRLWSRLRSSAHVSHPTVRPLSRTPHASRRRLVAVQRLLVQDVWSRFLHGGRSILFIPMATLSLRPRRGDRLTAPTTEADLDDSLMLSGHPAAFPQLLLALVALTTVGPKSWLIIAIVGFTTIPRIARITRGATVSVVERDFVAAAEALGESKFRIITRELLPNVTGPLLVEANLRLTYSITIIAGLGFLGFATTVNAADWGLMVQQNRTAVTVQPWGTVLLQWRSRCSPSGPADQ